jgi:hypothetical protein
MPRIANHVALFALVLGISASAKPHARAGADDELMRLTPRDVTLAVVVKDLRGHSAALRDSPFAEAFRKSRLSQVLAEKPEIKHLEKLGEQLSQALKVDWTQIRDQLLGDAVVFAYRGGPPGKPEMESGLILTWAPDEKFVDGLLQQLDEVQKKSGELKQTESRNHKGLSYLRRVKSKGADEYLFRNGPVFAFSSQESMIRDVIELDLSAAKTVPSPLARDLDALNARDAAIALWLNPRYFDNEFSEKLRGASASDAAFLTGFANCWKALNGVVLTCRVDRHLELNLTAVGQKDSLPPALVRAAASLNDASALNRMFPTNALTAITGRLDLPATLQALSAVMAPDAWKSMSDSAGQGLAKVLGKKNLGELPAHIGPDWGICILPPAAKDGLLPDVVAAVRIKPTSDGALEKGILDACDVVATLARLNYNSQSDEPVRLETIQVEGGAIKYLAHDKLFPKGFRPAWTLHNGFLMIGTSPEAIQRVDLRKADKPVGNEANRFVVFSFRGWNEYLTARRGDLVAFLPKVTDAKGDEIGQQIDQVAMVFELLDRLELVDESSQSGQVKLSLKLFPAQPLKK